MHRPRRRESQPSLRAGGADTKACAWQPLRLLEAMHEVQTSRLHADGREKKRRRRRGETLDRNADMSFCDINDDFEAPADALHHE